MYVIRTQEPGALRYQLICLLTGLRRNDSASMRWEHVNLGDEPTESRVWNVDKKAWEPTQIPPRT